MTRLLAAAAIGIAGLLAIAPTGRAESMDDLIVQAKKEGSVVMYISGLSNVIGLIQSGFSQKYGIKVDALEVNAGPQRQRVGLSVQANQVQVDVLVSSDTPFFDELGQKGATQNLDSLPSKASFPKEWWPGAYPFFTSYSQAVLVNTQHVDPASIKSWRDILNPKYKDHIVAISPAAGGGVLAFYGNIIDSQGPDYLKTLGTLNPAVVGTSLEGSQMVASGEKWIYLDNVAYNTVPLKAKGAPVEDIFLSPSMVVVYAAVAMKSGPHPAAARLMIDWLASADGQRSICAQKQMTCSLPNTPGSLPLAAEHKIFDAKEIVKRQDEIVGAFNKAIEK
jgi:iron(III) transport system substrate-binding protein